MSIMVAQWVNTTFTCPYIDPVSCRPHHFVIHDQRYGLTIYVGMAWAMLSLDLRARSCGPELQEIHQSHHPSDSWI